jgi:hypothetical protein
MGEEKQIAKLVARMLDRAKVPYMITGSIAGTFYGYPRMTRDVDIVVELNLQNSAQLLKVFGKQFYVDEDAVREATQQRGMFNLIHQKTIIKVDCIVRKDSEYHRLEFRRRREGNFEGAKIWFASPEDLILSKLGWAKDSMSELQLGDVKELLRMLPKIDWAYLDTWSATLGLKNILEKARS